MKTAYEQVNDLILLTQHSNEKYKSKLSSEAVASLTLLLKEIRDIIRVNYDEENTSKTAQKALQKKIDKKLKSGLDRIQKSILKELDTFIKVNDKLYYDQLKAVFEPVNSFLKVKKVKDSEVQASFENDYMTFDKSGAHTITSLWAVFASRLTSIIEQATTQAYLLDKSLTDYEADVYGINADTNVSKGNLDAVVSTMTAFAYAMVLKYSNLANTAIFTGYSWDAIMDSATSEICRSLNGKYWIYEAPAKSTLPYEIYAPAHHRCRTVNPPITKSYSELGINPDELTEEQKELLTKPNVTPFSYNAFIEDQPPAVQKEILGTVRYDMYKKGQIKPTQFYTRDGRKYSLAELQARGYDISSKYIQYVRK